MTAKIIINCTFWICRLHTTSFFIFVCNYKIIFLLFSSTFFLFRLCVYEIKIATAHTTSRHYHWDGLRQWRWATEKLELGFCTRKKIFIFSMFLSCQLTHSLGLWRSTHMHIMKRKKRIQLRQKKSIHMFMCHIHCLPFKPFFRVHTYKNFYFILYRKTLRRTCHIVRVMSF